MDMHLNADSGSNPFSSSIDSLAHQMVQHDNEASSVFVVGEPQQSNPFHLYIHVAARDIWVNVSWSKAVDKLLEQETVLVDLLDKVKHQLPDSMKARVRQALQLEDSSSVSNSHNSRGDFAVFPPPVLSSMPSTANYTPSLVHSGSSSIPVTPMTGTSENLGWSIQNYLYYPSYPQFGVNPSSLIASPPAKQEAEGPPGVATLFNSYPQVCTANEHTIEESIQRQVETNQATAEYIWSVKDSSLYEIGNVRAQQAMSDPAGAIKLVFPPNTFICAWEKDGSYSSPAFRPLHPHSNQWLKAQVCDKKCAYRAGTSSLKRPITIRDHFRKCVYLDENHPLKILCTLELAAHEKASQGLLLSKRRSRGTGTPKSLLSTVTPAIKHEPPSPAITAAALPNTPYSSQMPPRTARNANHRFSQPINYSEDSADESGSATSYSLSHAGKPYPTRHRGNSSSAKTSGKDTTDQGDEEDDDSASDWSPEKKPRSLRGVTSVTTQKGHKKSQSMQNNESDYALPLIALRISSEGTLFKIPDRSICRLCLPQTIMVDWIASCLVQNLLYPPRHSEIQASIKQLLPDHLTNTLCPDSESFHGQGLFSTLTGKLSAIDVDTSPFESSISSMGSPDYRPSGDFSAIDN